MKNYKEKSNLKTYNQKLYKKIFFIFFIFFSFLYISRVLESFNLLNKTFWSFFLLWSIFVTKI